MKIDCSLNRTLDKYGIWNTGTNRLKHKIHRSSHLEWLAAFIGSTLQKVNINLGLFILKQIKAFLLGYFEPSIFIRL